MHTKRAYDLLAEGFGAGFNGPLVLAAEQDGGLDQATLDGIGAALRETANVAAVSPTRSSTKPATPPSSP